MSVDVDIVMTGASVGPMAAVMDNIGGPVLHSTSLVNTLHDATKHTFTIYPSLMTHLTTTLLRILIMALESIYSSHTSSLINT